MRRQTTDGFGSIRAIRARYDYNPYGRGTKIEGDLEADFGFTGHYYHGPSGWNLALYRAYDAGLGRWLNRNPIGEEGGINLYGYVRNNPLNLIDRLGLAYGNPVSGPNGPVGPSNPSASALPYYPNGYLYTLLSGR